MTFGDILAVFGQHLFQLWPFRTIADWEQGVRLRAGVCKTLLTSSNGMFGTGVHAFIPFIDEIIQMDASVEVVEGTIQTCTTTDNKAISFGLVLIYRILDAKKVFQTIFEVQGTVLSEARASAGDLAATFKSKEVAEELAEAVYSDIATRLEEWGIELQEVSLSSCVNCNTIRLVSDSAKSSMF